MNRSREFAAAAGLIALGAAGALLVSTRVWQVVVLRREAPLGSTELDVIGRQLSAATTALALVALAGVAATLATRGLVRRLVGAVVAVAGLVIVWQATSGFAALTPVEIDGLRSDDDVVIGVSGILRVDVAALWPALSLVCGLLIALGGALVAWRGAAWVSMSARYEAKPVATTSAWDALDAGADPTQ